MLPNLLGEFEVYRLAYAYFLLRLLEAGPVQLGEEAFMVGTADRWRELGVAPDEAACWTYIGGSADDPEIARFVAGGGSVADYIQIAMNEN